MTVRVAVLYMVSVESTQMQVGRTVRRRRTPAGRADAACLLSASGPSCSGPWPKRSAGRVVGA